MKIKSGFLLKGIYVLISITIIYFALLPILSVFYYGMVTSSNSGFSIQIFQRVGSYMKNSLQVAVVVTILSTSFGLLASITLWRVKFPGRKLMRLLVLLPLINPAFVGSIAFVMLFGKRGLITHTLLGLEISPFGFHGIVAMQSIGLATLAYMIISSAIKKTDVSYEEAARNLGASEGTIFRTITLPLMMPEISVAAMLVFLSSMSDFGTPIIIGGNFQTLASDLYLQITGLYNMKTASISGMFLFLPCFLAFFIQRHYSEKSMVYSFSVIGEDIDYLRIKPIVKLLLIGSTGLFVFFVFIQFAFIIIGAFTEHWGYDYTFTLRYFYSILTKETAPFINSVKLAFVAGMISSLLGVFLAYIVKTKKYPYLKQMDFFATLPAAVPGILFGIGYLVTFKYPLFGIGKFILPHAQPVVLLGTGIIIYLICIYRYLYVGLKSGYALMEHLNPDLEMAAINLGASERRVYFDIIFPMLKPAFNVAFLKNFTSTMTTLGAIIFLLLPKNKVAVQQIFQIMTSSEIGTAAMMALMLSLLALTLLGVFQFVINFKEIFDHLREWRQWVSSLRKSPKNTGI